MLILSYNIHVHGITAFVFYCSQSLVSISSAAADGTEFTPNNYRPQAPALSLRSGIISSRLLYHSDAVIN